MICNSAGTYQLVSPAAKRLTIVSTVSGNILGNTEVSLNVVHVEYTTEIGCELCHDVAGSTGSPDETYSMVVASITIDEIDVDRSGLRVASVQK